MSIVEIIIVRLNEVKFWQSSFGIERAPRAKCVPVQSNTNNNIDSWDT